MSDKPQFAVMPCAAGEWRWYCRKVEGDWHNYVDDRGVYATQAEALAAGQTHQQLHAGIAAWEASKDE